MSGDRPLACPNMTSRQPQKSSPSARPRRARWNACECAFTKPGRVSRPDTQRSLLADEPHACPLEQALEVDHRVLAGVARPQPAAVPKDGDRGLAGLQLD